MRRRSIYSLGFTGLVAFLGFAANVSGQIQTVVQNGSFATNNQSIWSAGQAYDLTYTAPLLGVSWPAQTATIGPISDPFGDGNTIAGSISLGAGNLGLTFNVNSTGGAVSVNVPVALTYTLPTTVVPGQPFTVSTALVASGAPSLSVNGSQFGASLNAVANVSLSATASYTPGTITGLIANPLNITTPVITANVNQPIVSVNPGSAPKTYSIPNTPFSLSLQSPTPNAATVNAYTPNAFNISTNDLASSQFFSVNTDLASTIFEMCELPPPNGSIDLLPSGLLTMNYNLLTASLAVGPTVNQKFGFNATGFPITLVTSDGQMQSGVAGGNFTFTAPANNGAPAPFGIGATTNINNTFNNNTGMGLGSDFNYSLFGASLTSNADFAGVLDNLSVGPLINGTVPLGNTGNLYSLYNNTFGLTGFNSINQNLSLIVLPEPGSIALLGLTGMFLARRRPRRV